MLGMNKYLYNYKMLNVRTQRNQYPGIQVKVYWQHQQHLPDYPV